MPRDSAPTPQPYGATPDEWLQWDLVLGLTADLLPVVSNTAARISQKSSLKTLGKTPSLYNRSGDATGILKWTEKQSTGDEVEAWSAVADLGICLQTRRVRAIDIDVPEAALSGDIVAFVHAHLTETLPRRFRSDSGKCLLAFELEGDFGKRSFPVAGGVIEFLMTKQQCVVAGTHSGGARYQWDAPGGVPAGFPVLSEAQFEALYLALKSQFATGDAHEIRLVRSAEDLALEDEEARWLVENWETYGADREGRRLYALCPWKAEHSTDNGESESAWLLRGSGGFERGHFKCMHDHCRSRTRAEFLQAVGYEMAGFDVIGAGQNNVDDMKDPGRGELTLPLPGFRRNLRTGVIFASIGNLIRACNFPEVCECELAYDTFRDELLIGKDDRWRAFKDVDAVEIRRVLESKDFETIGREQMRDAIRHAAHTNQFDAAIRWLEGLEAWDGVERCARFLPDYMGTADTAYSRAVGLYAWTAHAGRVMAPGCKADMVIALAGPQGQRKSAAIAAIAPEPEFATEIGLHKIDDNLARKMRGVLVAEISELRGLNSTDAESIRAWITQRQEKWTPKFVEHAIIFLRRLVLWSTTNEHEDGFLADPTGERRWLPVEVERDCDVEKIEADRNQLWAEALARWRVEGIAWREAEALARDEHGRFKVTDPWSDRISGWLDEVDLRGECNRLGEGFKIEAVAVQCLGLDFARFGKREEQRIGKILRGEGLQRVLKRVDGRPQRVWTGRV